MREIVLRARDGSERARALVDDEDFEWLSRHRWKLHAKGYVQRNYQRKGRWHMVRMHRVIMGLESGDLRQVDHIDRNPLNNQRENLRIVRPEVQYQNQSVRPHSSAYRGVSWTENGNWQAKCRGVYLGRFAREEDAAAAARAARAVMLPFAVD